MRRSLYLEIIHCFLYFPYKLINQYYNFKVTLNLLQEVFALLMLELLYNYNVRINWGKGVGIQLVKLIIFIENGFCVIIIIIITLHHSESSLFLYCNYVSRKPFTTKPM